MLELAATRHVFHDRHDEVEPPSGAAHARERQVPPPVGRSGRPRADLAVEALPLAPAERLDPIRDLGGVQGVEERGELPSGEVGRAHDVAQRLVVLLDDALAVDGRQAQVRGVEEGGEARGQALITPLQPLHQDADRDDAEECHHEHEERQPRDLAAALGYRRLDLVQRQPEVHGPDRAIEILDGRLDPEYTSVRAERRLGGLLEGVLFGALGGHRRDRSLRRIRHDDVVDVRIGLQTLQHLSHAVLIVEVDRRREAEGGHAREAQRLVGDRDHRLRLQPSWNVDIHEQRHGGDDRGDAQRHADQGSAMPRSSAPGGPAHCRTTARRNRRELRSAPARRADCRSMRMRGRESLRRRATAAPRSAAPGEAVIVRIPMFSA